jgi:O-antigen/teichoic acid export membrane protein
LNWRKARSDLSLSFSAQLIYKLIGYVILAVLARYLSPDEFGQFFYAAAVAGMFVLVTDLGTYRYLLREAAASPETALDRFSEVLSLRLPAFLLYFALVAGFALLVKPDIAGVVMITGLYVALKDLYRSVASLFLGLRKVVYAVLAYGSSQVLLVLVVLLLTARKASLHEILWGHVAAFGALLSVGLLVARLRIGPFRLVPRLGVLGGVARLSLPFFMLAVLELIHWKVDTLMIGFFWPYSQVATYETAAKLFEASQFMMRPIMAIFLPVCAQLVVQGKWIEIERLKRKLLGWAAGLGLAIAGVVFAVAGLVIVLVYGSDYVASEPVLRVLYLGSPALYLSFVSLFVSNALHLERQAVIVLVVGVLANVVLNLFLIPPLGAIGAAFTSVVTQTIVAALLMRLNRRGLRQAARSKPDGTTLEAR